MKQLALCGALLLLLASAARSVMAGPCEVNQKFVHDTAELRGPLALGGFGAMTTSSVTTVLGPFCFTEKAVAVNDEEARGYVSLNLDRIASDAARGGGEWTTSLAVLLECPASQQARVGQVLQRELPQWLPAPGAAGAEIYEPIIVTLRMDSKLRAQCRIL